MLSQRFARAVEGLLETIPITHRNGAPAYRYPSSHADPLPYLFVDATLGQEQSKGSGQYHVLGRVEVHSQYSSDNHATYFGVHEIVINNVRDKLNSMDALVTMGVYSNSLGAPIEVLELTTETLRPRYEPGRVIGTIEIVALVRY
jgi:hypothetical protein